jgi:hypothetical protein
VELIPAATMVAAALGAATDRRNWSISLIFAVCGSRCLTWDAWGICIFIYAVALFVGGIREAAE